MNQDNGVPASPSGSREPDQQAVPALRASIPNAYCGFWLAGTTWDCRGDGYLWDADDDGYDPTDHSHPCPKCNTAAYLLSKVELAQCLTGYQWISTSGAEHWRQGVEIAQNANSEAATLALAEIGPIACIDWADPDSPDWDDTVTVIENASAMSARQGQDPEEGLGAEPASAVAESETPNPLLSTQAIPEGMVLVPREPSQSMREAAADIEIETGRGGLTALNWEEAEKVWSAMLAASPSTDITPPTCGNGGE